MNSNCPVHGKPFLDTPSNYPFAKYCLCSTSDETVEHSGNTKADVCTQSEPNSPGPSSITPHVATTTSSTCFVCSKDFRRWQDRDRHELTHLPFFLHCPAPDCEWRGNRPNVFKDHWDREHDTEYSGCPEPSETFDPQEILERIKNGNISLCEGVEEAILIVQVMGYDLQKWGMLERPWGRDGK